MPDFISVVYLYASHTTGENLVALELADTKMRNYR